MNMPRRVLHATCRQYACVTHANASLLYLQGACGFGNLGNAAAYPFFSAVGIPTNSDIMSFPTMGCGTCIEFQCVNDRTPGFAVGVATLHACGILWH